ncbi:MAG: metal-dependent hydrolase [Jiangellaceae bacterium]
MLAHTHALTGAVAWLALAPALGAATGYELVGGTVLAAGAALAPDLDHHKGTAAAVWGPLTRALGRGVAAACGGHRNGTHTLAAAAIAALLTWWAIEAGGWWERIVLAFLAGLAFVAWEGLLPGRWERLWSANLAASAGFGWWAAEQVDFDGWVGVAVAVGWVAHLAGDVVTDGGAPLLKPLIATRFRLTRLNTGGRWETMIGWVLTVAVVALVVAAWTAWPQPWTTWPRPSTV